MLIQIIGGGANDVCLRQAQKDAPPVGAALRPCPWGRERRYGQMQRIYIFGSREEK